MLIRHISETKHIPTSEYDSDIDSVFHTYSHNKAEEPSERDINFQNGLQAFDELMRKWEITLSDKEQREMVDKHFTPSWNRNANSNGNLDSTESISFVK